jgi:hypothetical protein
MAHRGIQTRFKLDNAAGTLTDVSTYLDSVQGSSDTDFLDGTNFQPDAVNPLKNEIPGFSADSYSLTGKWSEPAHTFWNAVKGLQNLEYEYRPDDPHTDISIRGTCSCGSYSGPQASVDGIITYSVELKVQSQETEGSAGSPA